MFQPSTSSVLGCAHPSVSFFQLSDRRFHSAIIYTLTVSFFLSEPVDINDIPFDVLDPSKIQREEFERRPKMGNASITIAICLAHYEYTR